MSRWSRLVLAFSTAVAGAANAHGADITLMSPNEEVGGNFGISVAGAEDINEDGVSDLIVGAVGEAGRAGRVYIFSGRDQSLLFELVSPNQETLGRFGHHVSSAGDVNNDGHTDVLVGASSESPGNSPDGAGRAYVFSGQNGGLLFELASPHEERAGSFGFATAGAGDVDGDGRPDLLVGARFEDPGAGPDDAGRAYLYSGQDGRLLTELLSPHQEAGGQFGFSVSGAGDINLDGYADVIVGASDEDPGTSPEDAGRAYIFDGRHGTMLFELKSPNEEEDGYLGKAVAGVGDVNQDGLPDVIVGAYEENPGGSPVDAGRAYIFSGRDGSPLVELKSPNEEENGIFGWSAAGTGDVDGDGIPDVIVGAYGEIRNGGGHYGAGRAYVFSGRDYGLLLQLVSPNEEAGAAFAARVGAVRDINQDGLADVIAGAALENPGGSPMDAGRAYVFLSSQQPAIHVGDLDGGSRDAGTKWQAQVTALVHDAAERPVSGALVTFDVNGRSRSCTTAGGGTCAVQVTVADSITSLIFSVTGVSKSGHVYAGGMNHDPDGDSSGTVIVVAQP